MELNIFIFPERFMYQNVEQLQSFTNYLRLTLVFIQNIALREKLNFCFFIVFC